MATEGARAAWGSGTTAAPPSRAPAAGAVAKLSEFRNQPFFDDKNRAFWILQSAGWTGYFVLRVLSGFANGFGASLVVHALVLTAAGYSITLLMASVYRRLIRQRAGWTWPLAILVVLIASAARRGGRRPCLRSFRCGRPARRATGRK